MTNALHRTVILSEAKDLLIARPLALRRTRPFPFGKLSVRMTKQYLYRGNIATTQRDPPAELG